MTSPLIRDGAVAIADGRILGVGVASDMQSRFPTADPHDLGDTLLLPGLVNAHVHVELSDLSPGEHPSSFIDWLFRVMGNGPPATDAGEVRAAAAARLGVAQCLRFGVTTVGDITRFPQITRHVLADSPLRAVSFGEVTAMGERRRLLEPRLAAAMMPSPGRVISAVSPHAPYSIEPAGYERCVAAASAARVPIATHLAESPDEAEFLADQAGPFRRLWDTIGGWDGQMQRFPGGPIDLAEAVGLLRYAPSLLVHVNYANEADLRRLAAGTASVVYCPRTHAYFDHPPHAWRRMVELGISVALGTDSTASSPNLNLVDDLRHLRRLAPEIDVELLWRLATINGAKALGVSEDAGSLAPGKAADLVAFPVYTGEPLTEVLAGDALPSGVWIAGDFQELT